jgi:hypothetical protein
MPDCVCQRKNGYEHRPNDGQDHHDIRQMEQASQHRTVEQLVGKVQESRQPAQRQLMHTEDQLHHSGKSQTTTLYNFCEQKVNFQEQLHAVPDEEYGTRVPAGRRATETHTEKHKQQVTRVRKEEKSR